MIAFEITGKEPAQQLIRQLVALRLTARRLLRAQEFWRSSRKTWEGFRTVLAGTPGAENATEQIARVDEHELQVRFAVIEIGAKEFMCVSAKPPFDHPHVFLDMGDDKEIICPYCSTLYRYDPKLDAHAARPEACALTEAA